MITCSKCGSRVGVIGPCKTCAKVEKAKVKPETKERIKRGIKKFAKPLPTLDAALDQIINQILSTPPVEWDKLTRRLATTLSPLMKQRLVSELLGRSESFARRAAYFDRLTCESTTGEHHAASVRRQNVVGRRVRKALGFTNYGADVTF